MNLSTIFSFLTQFLLSLDLMEFTFSVDYTVSKDLFALRTDELLQRHKFNIFQEALFCTLMSSANLVLEAIPIAAIFIQSFYFFF